MAYLIAMGHSAKLVKSEFDKVPPIPRHERSKKIEKSFEGNIYINFQSQRISSYHLLLAFN